MAEAVSSYVCGVTDEELFSVEALLKRNNSSFHRFYMTADEIEGVRAAWKVYHRNPELSSGDWGMPPYLELIHYGPDGGNMQVSLVRFEDVEMLTLPILEEE